MANNVYSHIKEFKRKYPLTVTFRLKAHCRLAKKFVGEDEEIIYAFPAQKNEKSYDIINTNVVILTNKRLIVSTKRVLFGYFYKMITPELFNDFTIENGIIWGKVIIDTVKEQVILSNIDRRALPEIESKITSVMIKNKKEIEKEEE